MCISLCAQELAFVRSLEPRITRARSQLVAHLAPVLAAALRGGHHAAALHCAYAHAELAEPGAAEVGTHSLL